MSLHPIIDELQHIWNLFKVKKAPGYDEILVRVIKKSFDLISAPLINIIKL